MAQQVAHSHVVNKTRLRILNARNEALVAVFDDARKRLKSLTSDKAKYASLIEKLILEGALSLLDTNITVSLRKEDFGLAEEAFEYVKKEFKKETKMDLEVTLNENSPLPANS